MIRAGDRVAKVLDGREHLVDVFVGVSPHFAMLRNASARRTMAKLVTVEQAAKIAGVDTAVLLEKLNAAAGDAAAPEPAPLPVPGPGAPSSAAPRGLLETPGNLLVDLDVREDLRAGREPFRKIMDAVGALRPDQVLRLRATFEPAPLFAVLGKRGLAHHSERLAEDDWRVWFFHSKPLPPAPSPSGGEGELGDEVVILDVRGLEPPEPMERTLEALARLPRGKTLMQLNVRVPQFLLPRLDERGFSYEIREQSAELVRIFIRHKA